MLQGFHGNFYKDSIEIQRDFEGFLKDARAIAIELIFKITSIELMVCLDVISYVLDASCSARAFSILKFEQNKIKSDPGAHDVILMTFSMVWMPALP